MVEIITRQCKQHGTKSRVTFERCVSLIEDAYPMDPLLALHEMARGEPLQTDFAIYRIESFGVNQELPPEFIGNAGGSVKIAEA